MRYEIFYLVGASREADLEKIKKSVNEIITSYGGKFEEKETLEKRRLSYNVKGETHGIYVARRFKLEKIENFKEINRKLNLENNVLRFIISRADELPELKSREERISEMTDKERKAEKIEKKAEKKTESKLEEKSRLTGDLPKRQEDMDKKLEEILNI